MKRVLLLGSNGMAGHLLLNFLREQNRYKIYSTSRTEFKSIKNNVYLDVFDLEKLADLIKEIQPDYIINCVGLLFKDFNENCDKAIFVNAYFPHFLDKLSKKYSYKLIHISTDCVFDGKKGGYIESDLPNETNIYGRSKALGEVINTQNLTIRTSFIGPEITPNGIGLFHWFMSQNGTISGYTQAIWSGVTTLELAKFINYLLCENINLVGLYHLCNNDKISKEKLLLLFLNYFNRNDIKVEPDKRITCDRSFFNTNNDVQYRVPSYTLMIQEMKSWMLKYKDDLYFNYKLNINLN